MREWVQDCSSTRFDVQVIINTDIDFYLVMHGETEVVNVIFMLVSIIKIEFSIALVGELSIRPPAKS